MFTQFRKNYYEKYSFHLPNFQALSCWIVLFAAVQKISNIVEHDDAIKCLFLWFTSKIYHTIRIFLLQHHHENVSTILLNNFTHQYIYNLYAERNHENKLMLMKYLVIIEEANVAAKSVSRYLYLFPLLNDDISPVRIQERNVINCNNSW